MNKKNKKGFTLTELIIVIVIIGILAAILIPSLSGYIKKAKVSKGEQNARNMTSLLIGEILFNDEEFLMPSDVVEVVKKSGYDLISELPEYSYWYDTETNTIKYVKLEDTITGVSAADTFGRSRVEALSESHPRWFYIDQTPNELKDAIDAINDLVNVGMNNSNVSKDKDISKETRLQVLDAMDEKVEEVSKAVLNLKKIKDSKILNNLKDFLASFNTTETLYYAESGYYNRQLAENYNSTTEVYVERAMFVNGEYSVAEEGEYESVYVNLLSPLIIPGSVTCADKTINTIVSGSVYLSANSGVNAGAFRDTVSVSNIANIQNILYTFKNVTPKYNIKEYRFRNGYTIQVDADQEIEILLSESGVILQKELGKDVIKPLEFKKWNSETNSYVFAPNMQDNKYLTIYDGKDKNPAYATFDSISYDDAKKYFDEQILSEYLIPTTEITDNTWDDFKYSQLFDFNSGSLIGKVEMRSSIEPFSTQYSGIIVDANMNGYKINSFGYITDVVASVSQRKETVDENGNVISSTIDGNENAVVTIELPVAARKFTNLAGAKVEVEYKAKLVEYVDYRPYGWDAEADPLRIPTGKVYYNSTSGTITYTEMGNSDKGIFTSKNIDISGFKVTTTRGEESCNQINITKVTIKVPRTNSSSEDDMIVIFTRYYK